MDLDGATGFDRGFLTEQVDPPVCDPAELLTVDGQSEFRYMHFSLAMHRQRRLARWVAWNIDGASRWDGDDVPRKGLRFLPDPRVGVDDQVTDPVYARNRLDRGHLARRADLLWGSRTEAEVANRHSFFFTNIAPQMDNFNQSGQNGIWGRLENAVLATTGAGRVSVLGGPVFAADDPVYRGVQVPLVFWKVLVYRPTGEQLRARAFLVTQSLKGLRAAGPLDEFATFEVTLPDLAQRTGMTFDEAVIEAAATVADPGLVAALDAGPQPVPQLAAIHW
jgi:endonuclease G